MRRLLRVFLNIFFMWFFGNVLEEVSLVVPWSFLKFFRWFIRRFFKTFLRRFLRRLLRNLLGRCPGAPGDLS